MQKPHARFAAAMVVLGSVFRTETPELMIDAYWTALADLPIEALEGAARRLIRSARFFPRPVEWAEAAEDWLHERAMVRRGQQLQLQQSSETLAAEDVRRLMDELAAKLGWQR